MKIAYIILAHKYPEQLIRLIHRLNTEKASFFVHVDKKTDKIIYNQIVENLNGLSNVYFLNRNKAYWAFFSSMLNPTVRGIDEMFKRNVPFDYVILLTGQDYPLKSNKQIEKVLQENKGKVFMRYHSIPSDCWINEKGGLDRIEYRHFYFFDRHFIFPIKRKFPKVFKPYGGNAYWCLPKECAEYVRNLIKQNPSFFNFFKHVFAPEEIFFQTVILNSPFKDSVINNDLRYIDWPDKNPSHPKILCKEDFEKLLRSSSLFARKFDITVDADILDMIDKRICESDISNQS